MFVLMSPEDLEQHLREAITQLESLLQRWASSHDPTMVKQAQILSYWIKTYSSMLDCEKSFVPNSIPKLKRRQIVNVDFGFRIGAELGGLHYAVVLDKANSLYASTVTVVPLGSLKENTRPSTYKVILQDDLFSAISKKATSQLQLLSESRKRILSFADEQKLSQASSVEYAEYKKAESRHRALVEEYRQQVEASVNKMDHLKCGSIANISQITTISKMRIKEPLFPGSVLNNIKVSTRDMACIDTALKNLYLEKGNFSNKT